MTHQVDPQKVGVGIKLLRNTNFVADWIVRGLHFAPLLWRHPSVSSSFHVYLLHLHECYSQGVGFGNRMFGGLPEYENIFEAAQTTESILKVAQCCIIVRLISRVHIEFEQCPCGLNLCNWIRDAVWGFCLVETGLQFQESSGSFPSYPSHFFEKIPYMTYCWVRGCG
jgi:hypothetical protein